MFALEALGNRKHFMHNHCSVHVCNVRDNDLRGEANGHAHEVILQKYIETNAHVRVHACPILRHPRLQRNQQRLPRIATIRPKRD